MMVAVLNASANRVDLEEELMRAEIAEITDMADRFTWSTEDAALTAALAALNQCPTDASTVRRYALAGEILSCAAEASIARADTVAEDAVRQLLQSRLHNEARLIGSGFALVARA
ncbi:hypothetical protein [Mycobacterium sp. C31M]